VGAVNVSNWSVEYSCPQCGGPISLGETDRLVACPHCRTRVYLVAENSFRYFLPAAEDLAEELHFIPYWRLKGLTFRFQPTGVIPRFTDTSLLSLQHRGLPLSLGLRPQAMKLRFVTPQVSGRFLQSDRTVQDLLPLLAAQDGENSALRAFIGETISQIYTPFYFRKGHLHDALLKRPVQTAAGMDQSVIESAPETPPWRISFVPTLCPSCGWDLDGEKDTLVLTCYNCRTLWQCRGTRLEKISFAALVDGPEPRHYLPFWRMKVRIAGLELASVADLIRITNLPRAISPELERTPLYFWSPAFKINPAQFLRWGRQMTVAQPSGESPDELPEGPLYPVTLPIAEALEGIRVTLFGLTANKRQALTSLPRIGISPEETLLVYHPFNPGPRELIHSRMGLTVDRAAMSFGSQL
jgi:DNA-directed RNA polymerase subunit RPC12/RpoP